MRICSRAFGLGSGALLVTGTLAAQGFEGTVNYRVAGDKNEMIQSYKAGKVRMEGMGMGEGWMIMDASTRSMKIVAPKEKMVMVMDAQGTGQDDHDKPAKVTALGTKETIAGRNCENFVIEDEESHEVCVAKGMGYFMAGRPGGPMGGPGSARGGNPTEFASNPVLAKMFKDGFFPLRITKLNGGKREVQLEATKIEEKSLDEKLFESPAGYQEMKMPTGMPGMRRRP